MKIDKFRGVDLTNSPTQVSINRSPDSVNMIRDTVGSIRKRMGYEEISNFVGDIRGVYTYNGEVIIHTGMVVDANGSFVRNSSLVNVNGSTLTTSSSLSLPVGMNSVGFEMNGKLYIKTSLGTIHSYLEYSDGTVRRVWDSDEAYVPRVFAGKGIGRIHGSDIREEPRGGEFIEPFNLASPRWMETFGGELSNAIGNAFVRLGRRATRVLHYQILQEDGEWGEEITAQVPPSDAFWFSLRDGNLLQFSASFPTARPDYVLDGEDWIRVTAEFNPPPAELHENVRSFQRSSILGFGGVNGARNCVIFGGDSENPNQFFYSKENKPTYFPDTNYAIMGEPNSAIMGFSTVDGRLAVHKDGREDVAVYMCNAEFEKDSDGILKTVFRITGSVKGDGAISRRAFASLDNDPLFLTRNGVQALTTRDILGGAIAQSRSYYIDGELRDFSAEELSGAHACVYNGFYMLCVEGKVYCLDGLQKTYERNEPQSAFQYECYVLDNIPANFMWRHGDDLYFAQNVGNRTRVCKFFSDKNDIYSYSDGGRRNANGVIQNGEEIMAYWDLPELYGNLFYQKKTFLFLAVQLDAAIATGIELLAQVRGLWRKIGEDFFRGRYFSWSNIVWSRWTWSTDQTTRALTRKFRLKKLDKARYRLQNGRKDEPFAIYSVALEFTENGKIR